MKNKYMIKYRGNCLFLEKCLQRDNIFYYIDSSSMDYNLLYFFLKQETSNPIIYIIKGMKMYRLQGFCADKIPKKISKYKKRI